VWFSNLQAGHHIDTLHVLCVFLYRNIILSDNLHRLSLRPFCESAVQHSLLFPFAMSQGSHIVVQCIAVNTRFLLTICKEAAGNAFLQLADVCHI
jgi:hypothetical protein